MPYRFSRAISGLWLGGSLLIFLTVGAGRSEATSYVGFGAGATPHLGTRIIMAYDSPETLRVRTGYGFEAQFGWEAAPWIDIEGALRYHIFSRRDTLRSDRDTVTGHEVIGFEGGIRAHPRRGITNSMPYVRGGLGSFSPTIKLNNGQATISGDPVLGYYVGIGYVHEMSSMWGFDVRATAIVYNAFNQQDQGVELHGAILALSLSVIVF